MTNQINGSPEKQDISMFCPSAAPLPMPEQILERPRSIAGIFMFFMPSLQHLPRLRSTR